MLIRILCFFSLWLPAACLAQIKDIHFFDVGQGNCAFVRFKEGPPLLVDAGSSWHPGETPNQKAKFRRERQEEIVGLIKEALPDLQGSRFPVSLNVVISHGDVDHYNWLPEIFKNLNPEEDAPPIIKARFLLGGVKSDYGASFITTILNFAYDKKLSYVSDYASVEDIPSIQCVGATCTILAAERTADTNRNSLVLKVRDDSGFSTILTGDATGATTTGILARYRADPDFLRTHILQASHHGADSDESNNIEWIAATQPSTVVISAGARLDYLHPRQRAIESFFRGTCLETLAAAHLLHYTPPPAFINYHHMLETPFSFARLDTGYAVAVTAANVFSTLDQGNMSFTPGSRTWQFSRQPRSIGGSPIATPLQLAEYFLTISPEVSHIIGFMAPEGSLTTEFIGQLGKMNQLVSCDLSRGFIDTAEGFRTLEEFARGPQGVAQLDLPLTRVQIEGQDLHKRLLEAWDNKYLVFPRAAPAAPTVEPPPAAQTGDKGDGSV